MRRIAGVIRRMTLLPLCLALVFVAKARGEEPSAPSDQVDFQRDVQPIFGAALLRVSWQPAAGKRLSP